MDLPSYVGPSCLCAFVVKNGGSLSSKARRALCEEAKGGSDDYIASAVYHNFPDSKRWIDTITRVRDNITDEQFHNINETLGLNHNDAVFIGLKRKDFMVKRDSIRTDYRVVLLL